LDEHDAIPGLLDDCVGMGTGMHSAGCGGYSAHVVSTHDQFKMAWSSHMGMGSADASTSEHGAMSDV